MVLTEDSLGTIVAAVAEGRRVFDNVRRFVRYGVAGGLAELIVMLAGPFLGLALPCCPPRSSGSTCSPTGLPGVAFGAEQAEPDVLNRPPRPPSEGVLSRRGWWEVATLAIAIAASCLLLACWLAALHRPWQTPLFCALAMGQLGVALTARSAVRRSGAPRRAATPFCTSRWPEACSPSSRPFWVPPLAALLGTVPPSASDLAWVLGGRVCPRRGRRAHEGATTPRGEETA